MRKSWWLLVMFVAVWLRSGHALALPESALLQLAEDKPAAALAVLQERQQQGQDVPEPLLRQVVTAAWRSEASWSTFEAAIRAFDLYKDRPWAAHAMAPFLARYAHHVLLNASQFVSWHRDWTLRSITRTAPQMPALVLSELPHLATLDRAWTRALADSIVTSIPGLTFLFAQELLAVDRMWAYDTLRTAAMVAPQDAVENLHTYLTEPWGRQLFAEAALRVPQWTIRLAVSTSRQGQAVAQALQDDPATAVLADIVASPYERDLKVRMAVFLDDLAGGHTSLAELAHLCSDERGYFRTLIAMQRAQPDHPGVAMALTTQATELIDPLNRQFEQPPWQRFRTVEGMSAEELSILLAYAADDLYTSSARGLFTRLFARMQQEQLTGEELLTRMQALRSLTFLKLAAALNRLEAFLATIPSKAQRQALLTRLVRPLPAGESAALKRALTITEVLAARLDPDSLHALSEALVTAYQQAESALHRQHIVIYGLLATLLSQRHDTGLHTPLLETLAARYRRHFADFTGIPEAQLFAHGEHVQRYFFYEDPDGQQSFHSFLARYVHDPQWQIHDHPGYVAITAQQAGRRVTIYANTPDDEGAGGSATLDAILQQHQPAVVVHRGHSIHVQHTLKRIPASARIVFLGNCGSSGQLSAVLQRAPQAHLLATRGIGSLSVNDPLLKTLNTTILQEQNVVWKNLWEQLTPLFVHNPIFEDYIPPHQNATLHFLQAYRQVMTAEEAGFSFDSIPEIPQSIALRGCTS